jgi:hypothetical protein
MTTLIPRDEIDAITARYGDFLDIYADQSVADVRQVAQDCRRQAAELACNTETERRLRAELLAEAAELDALVDRIEAQR